MCDFVRIEISRPAILSNNEQIMSDDERATDRWQNEGGKIKAVVNYMKDDFTHLENNQLTLIPPFEHKEPEDDDTGLPEHPIYTNYTKYMWKGHRRSGGPEMPQVSIKSRIGESRKILKFEPSA